MTPRAADRRVGVQARRRYGREVHERIDPTAPAVDVGERPHRLTEVGEVDSGRALVLRGRDAIKGEDVPAALAQMCDDRQELDRPWGGS